MKWYWILIIVILIVFGLAIYNSVNKKNTAAPKVLVDLLNGNLYNVVDEIVNK